MLVKEFWWLIAYLLVCFSITVALLVANAVLVDPWDPNDFPDWRCEDATREKFLREPANAMSNLIFIFVGLYALFCVAWERQQQGETQNDRKYEGVPLFVQALFGISALFGGYGSFHYHACGGCDWGGFLDLYSIFVLVVSYTLLGFTALLCVTNKISSNARVLSPKNVSIGVFLLWVLNFIASGFWREIYLDNLGFDKMKLLMVGVFGVLIMIWVAVAFFGWRQAKMHQVPFYGKTFFVLGASSLVIGVLAWFPEEIRGECPNVPQDLQLHAVWHAFIAFSLLWPYCHVRTAGDLRVKEHGILSVLLLRDFRASSSVTHVANSGKLEL